VGEDFQDNDSSGAGAEDGRGLVAHVLDQAPDIIGVSLEPMIIVLRPIEPAPGKATSIVGDNGVVRRQMVPHPFEAVGCASGTRDHDHERAAAVGLKVETSAGTFEETHVPSFAAV
jgi:hypothetical protein